MKRRTNKSHRVPNVKLRPGEAQPSSSLAAIESSWPEDSQFRSDDTTFKDTCPRPFRNVVLCATGIPDKPALFKMALELGASAISAFTDKVTHLIANSHGGAKYKCALEHNVPIVRPSWITENYEIWLHGDDVETDLEKSIEGHQLPIFSDIIICISGIDELDRRADIRRIVERQGGSYVKAIERPVRVTHLLCSGDEETDKMRYADKFVKRGEAQIHMVWEDWFWDSLKVKGRLDEARYNVRNPRPPPVELRNTQPNVPDSTVPSRSNSMQVQPAAQDAPEHDDLLDDEAARVKVIPDIALKVWTGLLERRGYEVAGGEVIRSPSKSQSKPRRSLSPPRDRRGNRIQKAGGVISAVRSTNTFEAVDKSAGPSRPLVFQRTTSSNVAFARQNRASSEHDVLDGLDDNHNQAGPSKQAKEAERSQKSGQSSTTTSSSLPQIFSGMRFLLLGEADTPAVMSAIEQSGGTVVHKNVDVDICIVRLLSGSALYRAESDESQRAKYRTECWLECCIHEGRICAETDHVSFVPLEVSLPIPGASSVQISLSGLDQSEACHTRRLLKAFGIAVIPSFSRKATHLLCPSGVGLKYNKAREWGIPVVSNEWLAAIASTGKIPSAYEYLIPSPEDVHGKGKGRATEEKSKGKLRSECSVSAPAKDDAMDVDGRMHDITNSGYSSSLYKECADVPGPPADPPDAQPYPAKPAAAASGPLDRQPTTVIDAKRPRGGFGEPTEMLGSLPSSSATASSYYMHPSSAQPLTQGSPLVRYGTASSKAESMVLTRDSQRSNKARKLANGATTSRGTSSMSSDAGSDHELEGLRRRASEHTDTDDLGNVTEENLDDHDKIHMRVPSSMSPSPMKLPEQRGSSISPAKLDQGAALALQESIASLLGKRSNPDEDDEDGGDDSLPTNEGGDGKGKGRGGAAGRRKRVQRAKPAPRAKARQSPLAQAPDVDVGISLSAFEPFGQQHNPGAEDELLQLQSEEQSVRVVYEDPAQLQERQRLMNMLKTTTTGAAGAAGKRGRKAAGSQSQAEVIQVLSGQSSASARVTRRSARMSGS